MVIYAWRVCACWVRHGPMGQYYFLSHVDFCLPLPSFWITITAESQVFELWHCWPGKSTRCWNRASLDQQCMWDKETSIATVSLLICTNILRHSTCSPRPLRLVLRVRSRNRNYLNVSEALSSPKDAVWAFSWLLLSPTCVNMWALSLHAPLTWATWLVCPCVGAPARIYVMVVGLSVPKTVS